MSDVFTMLFHEVISITGGLNNTFCVTCRDHKWRKISICNHLDLRRQILHQHFLWRCFQKIHGFAVLVQGSLVTEPWEGLDLSFRNKKRLMSFLSWWQTQGLDFWWWTGAWNSVIHQSIFLSLSLLNSLRLTAASLITRSDLLSHGSMVSQQIYFCTLGSLLNKRPLALEIHKSFSVISKECDVLVECNLFKCGYTESNLKCLYKLHLNAQPPHKNKLHNNRIVSNLSKLIKNWKFLIQYLSK